MESGPPGPLSSFQASDGEHAARQRPQSSPQRRTTSNTCLCRAHRSWRLVRRRSPFRHRSRNWLAQRDVHVCAGCRGPVDLPML